MADDDTTEAEVICMPCRGTGSVISNLGGSPSTVECPWCGGTGRRGEDIDAQARFKQEREAAGESAPDTAEPAPQDQTDPPDAA
jgi:RecJ-like exonuclease